MTMAAPVKMGGPASGGPGQKAKQVRQEKQEMKHSDTAPSLTSARSSEARLTAVLVRGLIGISYPIKATIQQLGLFRKNRCVVLPDTPSIRGMLVKTKDYLTWGELTPEMYRTLLSRRGQPWKGSEKDRNGHYAYRYQEVGGKKYKSYFSLQPPRKGFGRKGIKIAFAAGGGLGYRGAKINELLERMI